jgi:hypothetical protein
VFTQWVHAPMQYFQNAPCKTIIYASIMFKK